MLIPRKTRSAAAAPVAAVAAFALMTLGGCGQDAQGPGASDSSQSTAESSANNGMSNIPSAPPASGVTDSPGGTVGAVPALPSDPETAMDEVMTQLLQLHAQLKMDLGSAYSDAWIEESQLHVAVTTPEAEAAVREAGAVPYLTDFTAQQLQEAANAFRAWLGSDAAPPVQVHWLGTSGRTGSITVRVPAEQVQPLTDAVAEQQPAGAAKVIVEESSGPATPLGTNGS